MAAATQKGDPKHDAAFLGPVTAESESTWTRTLRVAGKKIQFKLDTGAEVTAVTEATYHVLGRVNLQKLLSPYEVQQVNP